MTPNFVDLERAVETPRRFTFVDHFCGAGGSSIGLREAGGELRLAANHWERAIETHSYNFPDADHLIADLSGYDMRRMPRADVLWTSPECTWHSPAGGRKRVRAELDLFDDYVPDAAGERSRMTMFDVIRAAETGFYKVIIVENVVEVVAWPLFKHWLGMLEALGLQWQMMCVSSAHIGDDENPYAPQWRDRIYFVFYKKGIPMPDIQPHPLAWCDLCEDAVESTQAWKRHDRMPAGKYGQQYDYVCSSKSHPRRIVEPYVLPAATAIDWTDLGDRLADKPLRKFKDKDTGETIQSPLAPATMRRIAMGAQMFWGPSVVAAAGNTWDASSNGHPKQGDPDAYHRVAPAEAAPLAARQGTAVDGVSTPPFVFEGRDYQEDAERRIHDPEAEPLHTVTATGRGLHNLVHPPFVDVARANNRARGVDEPLAPVTTGQNQSVVSPPPVVVSTNHEEGRQYDPTKRPLEARTTKIGEAIITPDPFITELWGTSTARTTQEPLSSVTAGGNHHGLTVPDGAFLSRAYGSRGGGAHLNTSPMLPMHPITARGGGNHALVIPYRRGATAYPVDARPLHTITTRVSNGLLVLGDLADVRFRILGPREHLTAQRFPTDYVVMGNKGEQTMQAGNAVSSNVAHYLGDKVAQALA